MVWPVEFSVEATGWKKAEAETMVYHLACAKFREAGVLDDKNLPVLPDSQLTSNRKELSSSRKKLFRVYDLIWMRFKSDDVYPTYEIHKYQGLFGNFFWRSTVSLKYPAKISFEALAQSVSLAEKTAALKALKWLYNQGFVDENMKPVNLSEEEEREMLENQRVPYPIIIPYDLQLEMKETLEHFKELQNHLLLKNGSISVPCDDSSNSKNKKQGSFEFSAVGHKDNYQRDIMMEKPLQEFSFEDLKNRSQVMYERYLERLTSNDPDTRQILKMQSELPIFQKKEEILRHISNNQVVVLSGETGSGKTTQVPQYILDSYIQQRKGSDCNIIVTQPRRISAIVIAARVAAERGENVGETVGYQVRFDKNLPKERGALLFCSTGILLRALSQNLSLDGVSHIIFDEIHERSIQTDLLLRLLKNILRTNNNIKVILMSATFNLETFSQYFNSCPVINVPGFVYPVQQLFLDDMTNLIHLQNSDFNNPRLNLKLFAETVKYIHTSQPPGAILCFLPGWNEIQVVSKKLHELLESRGSDYVIYPVHSRLSHEKQGRIFSKPPDGVRKIILATNIAETAITVNDIVYVVDSGFQKERSFCARKCSAAIGTQWISKTNVHQRKGRAGRVQPGVCYHLYPKKFFETMEDYPAPEMLRVSLEDVILDCKLYCPDMKAEKFLSLCLHPPPQDSVEHGIKELQMLEILDENENLTALGKSVVNFTSHPRLSKALVFGTFLRCLDPVLTICSFMSLNRDVFANSLEDTEEIRQIKKDHDQDTYSDHLALYNIYCRWAGSRGKETNGDFAVEHRLDEDSWMLVESLKYLFAEHLFDAGLVDEKYSFTNPEATCNENSDDANIVLSALCSAFYPNVVRVTEGEKQKGRLVKDAIIYSTARDLKAHISNKSVAYKEYHLPGPWFIYFSGLHSEARRSLLILQMSFVPGICLLLSAGCNLSLSSPHVPSEEEDKESDITTLTMDDFIKLSFCCSQSVAELLKDWQECFRQLLHLQLATPGTDSAWVAAFHEKFIPVLKKVLSTSQAPFIPGRKFCLVDGELAWEKLY